MAKLPVLKKRNPSAAGLSLMEVMVASLILFLVIVLMLTNFMSGLRTYSISRIITTTLLLAEEKMEQKLYQVTPFESFSEHGNFSGEDSSYSYSVSSIPQPYSEENLVEVKVSGPENISRKLFAAKFPLRFWGTGAAVNSTNTIYTVYYPNATGSELKIDTNGSISAYSPPPPATPVFSGTAVNPNQTTVWLGDSANKEIWSFSLSSSSWSSFPMPNGGIPAGISVDGSGNVWAADEKNQDIVEFNSSGTWIASIPLLNSGIPSGIAWDSTHNELWVGDTLNHVLWTYSLTTGGWEQPPIPLPLSGVPAGIAIDESGNIWVIDTHNNALLEYAAGSWYGPFSPSGGFSSPRGVAVEGENIYISDIQAEWECSWNGTTWNWLSFSR